MTRSTHLSSTGLSARRLLPTKPPRTANGRTSRVNLHKKGPAFVVYDFGESYGHKIAFISWTADDDTARTKMIYGSVRDTVRQSLDNFSLDINAYDAGDIDKGGVLRLLD
ncbi:Actin-depolymerizing factor homology domain [Fusarium oxysporum f. sp. vasinfectum]|uniref:ADF-H domain-containing protein n=1 Tax=Fusarium oxysporum f. sp. vasinfectum 25433 TaxID=1089449 RepID=X0KY13_FUSOX|nr:hypothetical protein FOTG_13454 [Fusarium oxysporum f. sp. vasinfectum 25433]KAK2678782.1 Actin-depolymerizing factor homology domain [Fusarium oxysporum f. sp. vasinfectum]KAK2936707.1 Actin-depolymerizing factor homology domain [Fusarium oxysporum f. sp. vasinfectum]